MALAGYLAAQVVRVPVRYSLGAYFHTVVVQYAWLIIIAALLFGLRPSIAYWKD